MVASKTTDAAKLVLRLPKHLHKQLKQRARRNGVSLNTEIVNELERHHDYTVPLTEIGLFSPEFARERSRGGHPPLSIGEVLGPNRLDEWKALAIVLERKGLPAIDEQFGGGTGRRSNCGFRPTTVSLASHRDGLGSRMEGRHVRNRKGPRPRLALAAGRFTSCILGRAKRPRKGRLSAKDRAAALRARRSGARAAVPYIASRNAGLGRRPWARATVAL